jgi:hypothetical protein
LEWTRNAFLVVFTAVLGLVGMVRDAGKLSRALTILGGFGHLCAPQTIVFGCRCVSHAQVCLVMIALEFWFGLMGVAVIFVLIC